MNKILTVILMVIVTVNVSAQSKVRFMNEATRIGIYLCPVTNEQLLINDSTLNVKRVVELLHIDKDIYAVAEQWIYEKKFYKDKVIDVRVTINGRDFDYDYWGFKYLAYKKKSL